MAACGWLTGACVFRNTTAAKSTVPALRPNLACSWAPDIHVLGHVPGANQTAGQGLLAQRLLLDCGRQASKQRTRSCTQTCTRASTRALRVGSTVNAIEQRLILATNSRQHKLALLRFALGEREGRTLVFAKKKDTVRTHIAPWTDSWRIRTIVHRPVCH